LTVINITAPAASRARGTAIVAADGRRMNAVVRRLGRERDIDAAIARDGLTLSLGE